MTFHFKCLRSSVRLKTQEKEIKSHLSNRDLKNHTLTDSKTLCFQTDKDERDSTKDDEILNEFINQNQNMQYLSPMKTQRTRSESSSYYTVESVQDNEILNEFIDANQAAYFSPVKSQQTNKSVSYESSYYLDNFEKAIKTVLSEESYSCLLNETDSNVIDRFSRLSSKQH